MPKKIEIPADKYRQLAANAKPKESLKESLSVFAVGSAVWLDKSASLEGRIVEISISATAVRYRIAWWSGRDRRTDWFDPSDIALVESGSSKLRIGFRVS